MTFRLPIKQLNNIYPELPAQYVLLEYLQSNGTQFIDTQCNMTTDDLDYEVSFMFDNLYSLGNYIGVLGYDLNFQVCVKKDISCWSVGNSHSTVTAVANRKYLATGTMSNTLANSKFYIDGTLIPIQRATNVDTSTWLFSTNNSSYSNYNMSGKVYYCKLWQGTALVRHFIPVKNKDTNIVGMYDLVSKQFYGNDGTGEFTAGPTIEKIEYVQSSGSQYIDTGYAPNDTSGFEITGASLSSQNCVWIGSKENTGATRWSVGTFVGYSSTNVHYGWNSPISVPEAQVQVGNKATLSVNYNNTRQYNLNGAISDITSTLSPNPHTKSAYLFTWNVGGSPSYELALPTKLYSCKITEGTTLVRNFIPVKLTQNSTTEYAMYDTVTSTVYRNAGTGAFTGGSLTYSKKLYLGYSENISTDYEVLEYIESTGTQYIDTGYAFLDDFSIECTFNGWNNNSTIFGCRSGNVRTGLLFYISPTPTYNIGSHSTFNSPFQLSANLLTGTHTFKASVNNHTASIWEDGIQTYNNVSFSGNYISGVNLTIFGDNFSGAVSEFYIGKIYNCKMWQGSALVRNFIPARKKSTNELGMLDKVNNVFYANAGTGTFTAGPEIEAVEYLESSGTQCIDTGFKPTSNTRIKAQVNILTAATQSSDISHFFGSRDIDAVGQGCGITTINNVLSSDYFGDRKTIFNTVPTNQWLNIDKNKNICTVNSTRIVNNAYIGSIQRNLILFGFSTATKIGAYSGSLRIKETKIWDNDVLVRNFIPVKLTQGSTVEYAMLDKVENKIYKNAGTGSFTGGQVINNKYRIYHSSNMIKLPSEYESISYIQSSGTQYIDTGIGYTKNTKVECKFRRTDRVGVGNNLFGAGSSVGASDDFSIWCQNNTGIAMHFPYPSKDTGYQLTSESITADALFTADLSTRVFTLNDKSYSDTGTTTNGSSNHIKLFTFGPNYSYTSFFIGRIYHWKQWDNNVLVRNLVPAKRVSDNVIGMYDTVTNTFFTNAGTGDFTGPT